MSVWVWAEHAAGAVAVVEVPQASKVTEALGLADLTALVIPCTAFTWSAGSPEYPPRVTVLARLPTMTTLFSLAGSAGSSGAEPPATLPFLSSTRSSAAIFSASVWWAGLWITDLVILV